MSAQSLSVYKVTLYYSRNLSARANKTIFLVIITCLYFVFDFPWLNETWQL